MFEFVLLVFLLGPTLSLSSCTGLTLELSCRRRLANPQLWSDFHEAFDVEFINSHFLFAAVVIAMQDGTLVDTGLGSFVENEKDSTLCKLLLLLASCSFSGNFFLQASDVITYSRCRVQTLFTLSSAERRLYSTQHFQGIIHYICRL